MFITFEGIEGSGKGTMLALTEDWLKGRGKKVLRTREPGGCPLGLEMRALLLDAKNSGICPQAELFMYLADRAQHVREIIAPALEKGLTVLCDRYADSTIVYQGYGRGLDRETLFGLNDLAVAGLWPELTIVLDLDEPTGLERARRRNKELGLEEKEGRFEAEALAFHRRIRQGYLDWAGKHPDRVRVVDASGSPEKVFNRVKACIESACARRDG